MGASRQAAVAAGSPWIPTWVMNPAMVRKKYVSSK
jgi:hypothetical protein